MNLVKTVTNKVKKNPELVAKLVGASGKSYPTIMRWLNNNDERLTSAACLGVICIELNLTQEQVLQPLKSA